MLYYSLEKLVETHSRLSTYFIDRLDIWQTSKNKLMLIGITKQIIAANIHHCKVVYFSFLLQNTTLYSKYLWMWC